jgi:hypothetical protein
VERALRWCRVPEHTARLLAGTPALSRAWVTPVLPVAGVALAYGRRVDPAYEVLAATPLAGGRLLLVRALAVVAPAVVAAAAGLTGAAWVTGVLVATISTGERLVAFGELPQIGYAIGAVLCAGIVASRWRSLDRGGAGWNRPSAYAG